MTVAVTTLRSRLQRTLEDTDESNRKYSDQRLLDALIDSVDEYNADERALQEFRLTTSDSTANYDPALASDGSTELPNRTQKTILIYFAALNLLRSEKARKSRSGIVYTNVAGRVDTTSQAELLASSIRDFQSRLNSVLDAHSRSDTENRMFLEIRTKQTTLE